MEMDASIDIFVHPKCHQSIDGLLNDLPGR